MRLSVKPLQLKNFANKIILGSVFLFVFSTFIFAHDRDSKLENSLYPENPEAAKIYEEKARAFLYPDTTKLWSTNTITVCWEPGSGAMATERTWVRNAIRREFGTRTPLNFVGWNNCVGANNIRILVQDVGPLTRGLGSDLNNLRNGMVLNFTFTMWSTGCAVTTAARRDCIEFIAVHEFGHAIGLAHEQNRPDTFGLNINNTCTDASQGTDGNNAWGPWDPDSVMNYCNPIWNNGGRLSALDVEGINSLYGGDTRISDYGYGNLPRFMADVDGPDPDGNVFNDYCRFVGNYPNIFLSCKLADANGFLTDSDYHFNSAQGIDRGYGLLPQYMADVDGNGQADYCRFVGNPPKILLSCNLAIAGRFDDDQYGFNSPEGIDFGQADHPRFLANVDGQIGADFCRFVGNRPHTYLSCILSSATGFGPNQHAFISIKTNFDQGFKHLPRTLISMNGDNRADYCRYVGSKPNIHLSCNFANPGGFDENQHTRTFPAESDAWYNK